MRLVLVEWTDAVYHDLWEPFDDMAPIDMRVQSVGWLAERNERYLTIVAHQQQDQGGGGISIASALGSSMQDLQRERPRDAAPAEPAEPPPRIAGRARPEVSSTGDTTVTGVGQRHDRIRGADCEDTSPDRAAD